MSLSSSFELFRRIARRLGVPARYAEDVAQDALLRGLEDACVPLVFGLHRRASWPATLRRLGLRIMAQGAFVVLIGTLVSWVSPSFEPWRLPAAVRAPGTAQVGQEGAASAQEGGASSVAAPVAPAARDVPRPTSRADLRTDAAVHQTPAPSITTAPRCSAPGSAVRRTVSQREWSLILDARSAPDAHNALADLEARRLLEGHAREFPRGRLAREREALLRQLR